MTCSVVDLGKMVDSALWLANFDLKPYLLLSLGSMALLVEKLLVIQSLSH